MRTQLFLLFFCISCLAYSQDIVYKPISPFFGGDSFNYQQIMASVNAQNDFTEESQSGFNEQSELDNFTDSLNRRLS